MENQSFTEKLPKFVFRILWLPMGGVLFFLLQSVGGVLHGSSRHAESGHAVPLEVYPYLLEQFHEWHRRMGIERSPLDNLPCC